MDCSSTPPAAPNCGFPVGYKPARSGAAKAYKKMSGKMSFEDAKLACEADNANIVMPKSVDDLKDIQGYCRE